MLLLRKVLRLFDAIDKNLESDFAGLRFTSRVAAGKYSLEYESK